MSRKINIGGDQDDFSYRYKRDVIEIKYENKNGTQTKITNLEIISRQLHVKVEEIQGCFKKNIASSFHHDIINGRMEIKDLEIILEKFIHKYVLCPTCRYPELQDGVCRSCGYTKKNNSKVVDNELGKLSAEFGVENDVDCVSNKYLKIKDKARRMIEKKKQKDKHLDTELEMEKIDYELTKDEWVNSDYGHSKLDTRICKILHELYDKRDELRSSKIYSLLDFKMLEGIEILIIKFWKCTKKSEFKILSEKKEELFE